MVEDHSVQSFEISTSDKFFKEVLWKLALRIAITVLQKQLLLTGVNKKENGLVMYKSHVKEVFRILVSSARCVDMQMIEDHLWSCIVRTEACISSLEEVLYKCVCLQYYCYG